MDPKKVVVLGAGPGPIHGLVDELTKGGCVIEHKCQGRVMDFEGDVAVLPRRVPEDHHWPKGGKTGAARIKREAKRRSRKRR